MAIRRVGAAALVLAAALWVATRAAAPAQELRNPIPPSSDSLARGRALYAEHCAICHGVTGRGDGPLARTMVPRPADLRVHLAEGHSDAELFDWVSNGIPDTGMGGFADVLSEEDRWHVINYILTFVAGDR
ncbi:MAG TPA: c-type cytochrome [Chloroflexota bacterium]|jgi:mono/diheme cytochrome c family protein|nr:c-type cytochrome [Chloroflexota bacterium]